MKTVHEIKRLKDIMGELTKLGYECKIDSIAFDVPMALNETP